MFTFYFGFWATILKFNQQDWAKYRPGDSECEQESFVPEKFAKHVNEI